MTVNAVKGADGRPSSVAELNADGGGWLAEAA